MLELSQARTGTPVLLLTLNGRGGAGILIIRTPLRGRRLNNFVRVIVMLKKSYRMSMCLSVCTEVNIN